MKGSKGKPTQSAEAVIGKLFTGFDAIDRFPSHRPAVFGFHDNGGKPAGLVTAPVHWIVRLRR
ncbi:MAG: hypothetical protein AAGJ40_20045 [Planctomycetota bacterium]